MKMLQFCFRNDDNATAVATCTSRGVGFWWKHTDLESEKKSENKFDLFDLRRLVELCRHSSLGRRCSECGELENHVIKSIISVRVVYLIDMFWFETAQRFVFNLLS